MTLSTNQEIWQVLLPLPLKDGFDYRVDAAFGVQAGSYLRLNFGGKDVVGIAWMRKTVSDVPAHKIKSVLGVLPIPPLGDAMRQFVDWVSAYTMNPRGAVLKMVMAEKSVFAIQKRVRKTPMERDYNYQKLATILEPEQENAARILRNQVGTGKFSATLLEGVTGSGKTEVYFQAIEQALDGGKQVLLMLPEIALSDQLLRRFSDAFGAAASVWHSDLKTSERRQNWLDVALGRARVVIGARSALFLPFSDLGLIVVDEEHEGAYKQEEGVLYHGRDMAVMRASLEKIPAVLVSATPSLETLANVQSGKYRRVHLSKRYNQATMPQMRVIDLCACKLPRGRFLSDELIDELKKNIENREQSLLFLNRRGYAPLTLCRSCGTKVTCKRCSAWLVEHQQSGKLTCHHCGYSIQKPKKCASCNAEDNMHPIGPGVERIAEELKQIMPNARVSVMSSDLADSPQKIAELVQSLELGEIDIIIGTQMVAKGYHFPRLTMVGVVDADLGLSGGDLRAAERTYQLLLQVGGRSGRSDLSGRVYLQTYQSAHPVLQALIRGDGEAFYELQMEERKLLQMPPFSRLASVIVAGTNSARVSEYTAKLARAIPHNVEGLRILGPAPAPLSKLRGKYRERFLIKAARNIRLQDYLRDWIKQAPTNQSIRVQVDIDPYSFV